MDRLDAMALFVRVSEAGSFSAVAQQMGVARSIVTRQIAALESHLCVKLLARTTRRLSLTSAGAAYLEKCRMILDMIETAETDLGEQTPKPRGKIRLSIPHTFGHQYLTPLLFAFATQYPEISLDIDYSDRRSSLFEEGLDLAIRITLQPETQDIARKISYSDMVVVASPDYLAQHGTPIHPSELLTHQCLSYTAAPTPNLWPFILDDKMLSFPIRGVFQANSGAVLLEAAIRGMGITLSPRFIAIDAIKNGEVIEILANYPIPRLGIFAILPSNRLIPHRVRVLMDFLDERLGSEPPWQQP